MKRTVCILLTLVLIALCIPAVTAVESTQDKISPQLRALIDAHPEGGIENGVVVQLYHHNPNYPTEGVSEQEAVLNNLKAQAELSGMLSDIGYWESGNFSVGWEMVGLPYENIEKVAALEYVDYIDLPHDEYSTLSAEEKYDERLRTAFEEFPAETKVRISLWLAYNEHAYIGMAEPDEDASDELVEYYMKKLRSKRRDYHAAKNEEYAAVIRENCNIDGMTVMKLTPIISVSCSLSEVEKIASLKEVALVSYDEYITVLPSDRQSLEEKFEGWMYDTKKIVKYDPELVEQGLQNGYMAYNEYQEICANDDWALVFATTNSYDPWEVVDHIRIGNRILSWYMPGAAVYPFGYFIYNAAEDTFYPIERFVYPTYTNGEDESGKPIKVVLEPTISLEDYPGLVEALDELEIGRPVGDADGDSKLTILDATRIQRVKVGLDDADEEADLYETGIGDTSGTTMNTWKSWSDADDDGSVTVLDATRIQRTIARMCTIDGAPTNEADETETE